MCNYAWKSEEARKGSMIEKRTIMFYIFLFSFRSQLSKNISKGQFFTINYSSLEISPPHQLTVKYLCYLPSVQKRQTHFSLKEASVVINSDLSSNALKIMTSLICSLDFIITSKSLTCPLTAHFHFTNPVLIEKCTSRQVHFVAWKCLSDPGFWPSEAVKKIFS